MVSACTWAQSLGEKNLFGLLGSGRKSPLWGSFTCCGLLRPPRAPGRAPSRGVAALEPACGPSPNSDAQFLQHASEQLCRSSLWQLIPPALLVETAWGSFPPGVTGCSCLETEKTPLLLSLPPSPKHEAQVQCVCGYLGPQHPPPLSVHISPPGSQQHRDLTCCRRCTARGPWSSSHLATNTWGQWADVRGSPAVTDPKNHFWVL